ncbi:MAG: molybdopterin molybdotransferase MoeA [Hyphomicrobiaceae bacterium]
MAKKLLDDCFLHDADRLRHDDAIALLADRIKPIATTETIPLANAAGRILASPAVAIRPVPLHTNAAVDGYAFEQIPTGATEDQVLPLEGRAAAGHPLEGTIKPGHAARIFTGAVLPSGTNTVVMQEDVETVSHGGNECVRIPKGLKQGANVRQAGEDVEQGHELFAPGDRLRPQDLAALASIGLGQVDCYKPIRVGIVSTGDEIVRAGERPLQLGEVYDANAPMLNALSKNTGASVSDLGIWPDDAAVVQTNLKSAAQDYDVLLTSGGASRGEEDHMVSALDAIGKRHIWQLAVKPGRPMTFGQINDTIMVGLPGNPVAVFVCFLMYVAPMLSRLAGAEWKDPRRYMLPAAFDMPKRKTGRREFLRGFVQTSDGSMKVAKFPRDGSGLISGLRAADGLIDIPEDTPKVSPGDSVAFIPFTEFGIVV